MSEIEDARAAGTYVIALDDPDAMDRALVGGKGENLARLVAAGMPVPDGFCVTTLAYETVIDDSAIQEAIRELSDLDHTNTTALANAGATLRTQIQERGISEEVRDAIETAVDSTSSGPEDTYAVRSSATAEDLPEASFAGQHETFLNVPREEITDRIRACMASLFTDRVIAYRARNDIPHEDVALAVVIQRMISPEVSGICFTADPLTGNRHIASIEAGFGLGEVLVSGDVTADTMRVDTRTGEVLDYETGDQQIAVRMHPEGGTETIDLPPEERASHVLSDEQARTLVEMGEEIEELFECPQDIEWCLDDRTFSIVQARPITSLFPLPSPEPEDNRLHVYLSAGHAQAFPEAMPPLVRDIWRILTLESFAALGLDPDTQWAVEAGGRLYVDLTPFLRIGIYRQQFPERLSKISEPAAAGLDDLLAQQSEEFRTERSWRETLAALPSLAGAGWRGVKMGPTVVSKLGTDFLGAFIGKPTPEREEARWAEWGKHVAAQVRAPATPAGRARAVFDAQTLTEPFVDAFLFTGSLFAAFAAGGWLQRRFPDAPKDVNDVGRGFPRELVTRINLGLGDLADVARDHTAVAEALREEASLAEIETVEGGEEFRAAFDAYLDEFGHRATGEIDLSRPRWHEDPSVLLASIRTNLTQREAGEHHEHLQHIIDDAETAADRLCRRADRGLFGPIRTRMVRRLIKTFRGYVQTREYPKHGSAYLFTAWREVLLDAGETLTNDGQLNSSDEVWFLRKEELFAALDGDPIEADIAARRAEFERHAEMDAPPLLTSEGEAPSACVERTDIPEGALAGTGVSGGVVEGLARVVRDPAEDTIEKDEIIIAPSSDPGWTPLFLNAAGMVVEVGGRMSHGALVAREYGLPAVVSVPEATQHIETGQRVRVDGTQGIIEVVE